MKKSILLILVFISFGVFAGLTTAPPWTPGPDKCGSGKFRCPQAGNKCIRKPKKRKCETIKLIGTGKSAMVRYVDWCKRKGETCIGRYDECSSNDGGDLESSTSLGEINPYAACAP